MNCIHSHEGGAYCDKHDHGAVTVGCCGEESCPDREVLTRDDGYVLKSSVLSAIHNGNIDMGLVTPHEYRLLEGLSIRIDRRIQSVPAADVRPVVRGKWGERRFSETVYGAECSVCHTTWDAPTNFCPYCGAYMREVDNG